ncbi:TPA: hypothetical protein WND00_002099 [Neisseria gonorrhoeae]
MFNIFQARRGSKVGIARGEKDLLAHMSKAVRSRQSALDALGDHHGDVDLRLVGNIERSLRPYVGSSDAEGALWFQSMDFYGNGIRHLEFQPGAFPTACIPVLGDLLVGEHASFGILCWAPEVNNDKGESEGIVIFNDCLILTARLAAASGHA